MADQPVLHGYRYSVYNRIARVALHEKGLKYKIVEVNPFADDLPASYLKLHPFGRVPVLCHGDFSIYETRAIVGYVDAAFAGRALRPTCPKAAGRMAQVMSIIDSYGYWPMVRQVFSNRVIQPLLGEPPDEAEIDKGLKASRKVLLALEDIAQEARVLNGEQVTLADCFLGPMMDYFTRTPEGEAALATCPALSGWWQGFRVADSMVQSDPGLTEPL